MKIAFVHNIANNFFSMARYFRDLGHDAHLFCQSGYDKWLPQHDDPRADGLPWVHFEDLNSPRAHQFSFLRDFDRVVCTGFYLAPIVSAGIKVHCYVPYGGDVTDILSSRGPDRMIGLINHFNAMKHVPLIIAGTVESVVNVLEAFKISHIKGYSPAVYVAKDDQSLAQKSLKKGLRIFSPARHLWVSPDDCPSDYDIHRGIKRNDILIRAFDKLTRWSRGGESHLLLVNYGPDVAASVKLLGKLGLDGSRVSFFKRKLRRWELFRVLEKSDVMANAFRSGLHQFGTGVQEALAAACVVANQVGGGRSDIAACPILDASDEDELFYALYTIEKSVELRRSLQGAAQHWFRENLGLAAAQRMARAIELIDAGLPAAPSVAELHAVYSDGLTARPTYYSGDHEHVTEASFTSVTRRLAAMHAVPS